MIWTQVQEIKPLMQLTDAGCHWFDGLHWTKRGSGWTMIRFIIYKLWTSEFPLSSARLSVLYCVLKLEDTMNLIEKFSVLYIQHSLSMIRTNQLLFRIIGKYSIQVWQPVGCLGYLGHLLPVGFWVEWCLCQQGGVFFWSHSQLIIEGVMPNLVKAHGHQSHRCVNEYRDGRGPWPFPCRPSWLWCHAQWGTSEWGFLFCSEPHPRRSCPSAPCPPSLPDTQKRLSTQCWQWGTNIHSVD